MGGLTCPANPKARFVALTRLIHDRYPALADAVAEIEARRVVVDGVVATNPRARARQDAAIKIRAHGALRGAAKLRAALDAFDVDVTDGVAVDVGASTGGFTSVLLDRGARRVYAVDVGHGQLLGHLRQDPRVVNLERTNLADLDRVIVPDIVDVVTIDVSYVPLAHAVPQLEPLALAGAASLIGLVKPMYELGLGTPPADAVTIAAAVAHAVAGIEAASWSVVDAVASPVRGGRGAVEHLVHARRRTTCQAESDESGHARPSQPSARTREERAR
jgi:23S rRNA (cytidine1920-2'-O)/16S rRNA (cytidine1409-2'-O)-methyltransferase